MNIILQCNIIILAMLCQFCFANNEEDLTQLPNPELVNYVKTDNLEKDVAELRRNFQHLEQQNGKKDQSILTLQNEVANLKAIQEMELKMAGKETFNQ
jgi:predicted transposase YbfD/YdcC